MIRLTEIKIKTAEYGQYYKCDKTLVSFPCSLSGMSLGPDPYKTLVSFPCSLSGMSLGPDPMLCSLCLPPETIWQPQRPGCVGRARWGRGLVGCLARVAACRQSLASGGEPLDHCEGVRG